MKLDLLEPELKRGDIETNYKIIGDMIEESSLDKPDVIVLPEIWNTSSWDGPLNQFENLEIDIPQKFLSNLSKKSNSYIVGGSVINKREGKYYNTALIYDNYGRCIAKYDKVHLFNDEKDELTAGDQLSTFYIGDTLCGIIICYDLDYPEWIRKYALLGIKILFVPAAWESDRIDHYETLLKARAIENQIYVVGVNSVGLSKYGRFGGCSNIINPKAEKYINSCNKKRIINVDLDLNSCDLYNASFNLLKDRRDDLY